MCQFVFLNICFCFNSVSISQRIIHSIYLRFQSILLGEKRQFLSTAHVLAIIFLSLFFSPLFLVWVFFFYHYSGGSCQMQAITPCCDPQGGGVAEVTRVEPVEISCQSIIWNMLIHRRNLQESWYTNTNFIVLSDWSQFALLLMPSEMTLKPLCLYFCMAFAFEDFSCRCL